MGVAGLGDPAALLLRLRLVELPTGNPKVDVGLAKQRLGPSDERLETHLQERRGRDGLPQLLEFGDVGGDHRSTRKPTVGFP